MDCHKRFKTLAQDILGHKLGDLTTNNKLKMANLSNRSHTYAYKKNIDIPKSKRLNSANPNILFAMMLFKPSLYFFAS